MAAAGTVLDGVTQRRLPSSWQRHSCKPLLVLQEAIRGRPLIVYSASAEDGRMTADQAVLYHAGFALYQNNMVTEAVIEFKRYLELYPEDRRAAWLLTHVLLSKQFASDSA